MSKTISRVLGLRRAAVNRTKGGKLGYVSSGCDRKSLADLFRSLRLSLEILIVCHGQNLHPVRCLVNVFTLPSAPPTFFFLSSQLRDSGRGSPCRGRSVAHLPRKLTLNVETHTSATSAKSVRNLVRENFAHPSRDPSFGCSPLPAARVFPNRRSGRGNPRQPTLNHPYSTKLSPA